MCDRSRRASRLGLLLHERGCLALQAFSMALKDPTLVLFFRSSFQSSHIVLYGHTNQGRAVAFCPDTYKAIHALKRRLINGHGNSFHIGDYM